VEVVVDVPVATVLVLLLLLLLLFPVSETVEPEAPASLDAPSSDCGSGAAKKEEVAEEGLMMASPRCKSLCSTSKHGPISFAHALGADCIGAKSTPNWASRLTNKR
jgi:hypothetical protein